MCSARYELNFVVKVFHSTSASYHIYVLHLSDEQTGESLETVKKECFSEIGVYWREKHFQHFLVFIELRISTVHLFPSLRKGRNFCIL